MSWFKVDTCIYFIPYLLRILTVDICVFLRGCNPQEDLLPPGVSVTAQRAFPNFIFCTWYIEGCYISKKKATSWMAFCENTHTQYQCTKQFRGSYEARVFIWTLVWWFEIHVYLRFVSALSFSSTGARNGNFKKLGTEEEAWSRARSPPRGLM